MPRIVIPSSNAALVEQLRVTRMAKSKLDKEDKDLTKRLKSSIQRYIDDAGFTEATELVVQDTNLVVKLVPNQGAARVDQERMAELVAPDIIEQVIKRTPYHQITIARG